MPIDIAKNFVRIRVRDSGICRSGTYRVHDIGREGHSKRLACVENKTGKWTTISWFIAREDVTIVRKGRRIKLIGKDVPTRRLLASIRK